MILCMRRAWENEWESWVGGNNVVVCSWVGVLRECLNRSAFVMVGWVRLVSALSRDR